MNSTEHVLACLSEECSEISEQCNRVSIRISKALRFGLDEVQPGQLLTNMERVAFELADLLAVAEVLEEKGIIARAQKDAKKVKLREFMEYAEVVGALEKESPKPAPEVDLRSAASSLAELYRGDPRVISVGARAASIALMVDQTKHPRFAFERPSWRGWPVEIVNHGPMAVMGGDPNADH